MMMFSTKKFLMQGCKNTATHSYMQNQLMMRWFGKIIRINLPDLGEGTKDATIKEWFVKEGQKIKEVSLLRSNVLLVR